MAKYYRLEQNTPNTLPTHWAYSDADKDEDWNEGFQVFSSIGDAILAGVFNRHPDGDYSGYAWLLQVTPEDEDFVIGGGPYYFAIEPGCAVTVRSIPLDQVRQVIGEAFFDEVDFDQLESRLFDEAPEVEPIYEDRRFI